MNLEQLIETTMADRAGTVGAAGFTAAEVFHKGRSRRRARRALAGLAAVALVLALAVAGTVLRPGHTGIAPAGPPAPPWPIATSAPQAGPSTASLRISFANGPTIVPWNAEPITLALPPLTQIMSGARVQGGWVVSTSTDFRPAVTWFQPDHGDPVLVADSGSWAASSFGRVLVVGGENADPTGLTAYRLPDLTVLARTHVDGADLNRVARIAATTDQYAVVYQSTGNPLPVRTSVWNLATGNVTALPAVRGIGGISADGTVLRFFTSDGVSCVDTAPVRLLGTFSPGGYCSADLDQFAGVISPDGTRALFSNTAGDSMLVFTEGLRAGQFGPTPVTAAHAAIRWDTATTFLAYGDGDPPAVLRCNLSDECAPIGLPAGDPRIIFLRDPY
jgi:hypothetical protein